MHLHNRLCFCNFRSRVLPHKKFSIIHPQVPLLFFTAQAAANNFLLISVRFSFMYTGIAACGNPRFYVEKFLFTYLFSLTLILTSLLQIWLLYLLVVLRFLLVSVYGKHQPGLSLFLNPKKR